MELFFLDPNPTASKAVLLLHGLGANGSSWALQLPALAEAGFRPLAPDAPGFGQSRYDGHGWSLPRAAGMLAGLLDELSIEKVDVIGLSMGGVIAQQFALDHPSRTGKLVLVSTFAALRPNNLSQAFYFIQRALVVHLLGLPQQAKLVARRVFPHPEQDELRRLAEEQIASADPRAYRAAMRALGTFDSRHRLGEILSPALVVSGESDSTVPVARQRLLAEFIPQARQVVVPNANHAVPVDQPELFNRLVVDFLKAGSPGLPQRDIQQHHDRKADHHADGG